MLRVCYCAEFLAFFVRAFAAAFDAFVAISFRLFADSFLARAIPPRRAIREV